MHSPKQLCPRRVPRDQFGGTSRVCIRPARDSKQANLLRQSLETMGTPIDEVEIGASDKVANGLRPQHLATTRKSDYPCRDMDGDPLSVATAQFDLTVCNPLRTSMPSGRIASTTALAHLQPGQVHRKSP